jgi:hypothetical protein
MVTDPSKLGEWWVTTSHILPPGAPPELGKRFSFGAGYSFESVHGTLVFCHRDAMPAEIITSPEGVEMTEEEFYELWKAEKSKSDAQGA